MVNFSWGYSIPFRLLAKPWFPSPKFNMLEKDVSSQLLSCLLNPKLLIVSIYSQGATIFSPNIQGEDMSEKKC